MMAARSLAGALLLAALSGAAALKLSASAEKGEETLIEVELYHVAFGSKRVTRDAVKTWAESSADKLQAAVEKALRASSVGGDVKVRHEIVQKPSETRAGGSEEIFLDLHVDGLSAQAMEEQLSPSIKKALLDAGGDFGGAMMQDPVYKELHKKRKARDERASGKGDPHLTNIHGEKFDLFQPGNHVLIQIPRHSRPEDTLLRVEADAQQLGGACADLYFQVVNITGSWLEDHTDGLQFYAKKEGEKMSWMRFGELDLKVVWGHLATTGTTYLNFFVKHLAHCQYPIGGLLGEDDHAGAATPGAGCGADLSLHSEGAEVSSSAEGSSETASIAEALMED